METKRRRKQELKERKNYLPTIGLTFGLWGAVVLFVFLVDPQRQGAIPLFFLLIFMGSFFTFSILFGNTRRGILVALATVTLLGLRVVGMANPLNILLLLGAFTAFELYFSKNF